MAGREGSRSVKRERPLDSDGSELDSELSVSTCLTLGSWLDLPELQLPNKFLQRPYRKRMLCCWHAFYWVWLWVLQLRRISTHQLKGEIWHCWPVMSWVVSPTPWWEGFVCNDSSHTRIPSRPNARLHWSVVSRADVGNKLTLLTS